MTSLLATRATAGPSGMTAIMMGRPTMPAFAGRLAQARRCATRENTPVPPGKLEAQVEDEVDHYASQRWPQLEAYSKLPAKMIKKVCDLRQHAEGSAAAEGFE